MAFDIDTEASVFESIWPSGYKESFEGYVNGGCPKYGKDHIKAIISAHYNKDHDCLEIGCGGGMWTEEFLIPNFRTVTCLDVVSQKFEAPCHYIQVENKDFYCTGVEDDSIDFLFSYGVFCHLSKDAQATYLKSVFNKMRSGAKAIILFANYKRHPAHMYQDEAYFNLHKTTNPSPTGGSWFYMDLELTKEIVEDAGFVSFTDLIPDFRDTLGYFEKP